MKIFKSILIRIYVFYQDLWVLLHYKNVKNLNKIDIFKNKHKKQKCFIIGNGPSLLLSDLVKLKNSITFASNSIFSLIDGSDYTPTYYFCQDSVVLKNNLIKIRQLNKSTKFIQPYYRELDYGTNVTFYKVYNKLYKNGTPPKFSNNMKKKIYEGFSVTFTMLQFAIYMGFEEIYLIGVDFNYNIEQGKISSSSYPIPDMAKFASVLPDINYTTLAFNETKTYCDNNGIKIRNSTRGGKLEVFVRESIEKVMRE